MDEAQAVDAASPFETFREACRRGRLAYQEDGDGTAVFYPRLVEPGAGGAQLRWRESAGGGTVYAATTLHPRGGQPYNLSLVELDEGFRMMSRIDDVEPEAVRIGMRVEVRFAEVADGEPWPVFVPAPDRSGR